MHGEKLLLNSMYSLAFATAFNSGKKKPRKQPKQQKNNNKTTQKTNCIIIMKINEFKKKKTQKQK